MMRVQIRGVTRLTIAFSKKRANLWAALFLCFACNNFVRIHGAIRVAAAMEAGSTDHLWTIRELL
jgi:hypothetical protein